MAGILYFVHASRADLVRDGRLLHRALPGGLGDVLWDVRDHPDQVLVIESSSGPGGKAGCVLYAVPNHREIPGGVGYFPDRQTWRLVHDDGAEYCLGWMTDAPPLPTDLERRDMLSGWQCPDGLLRKWAVPVVMSPRNPRGNLPWEVDFDDGDNPVCAVSGRYRKLWDDCKTLWDWAVNRGQPNREGLLIVGEGFTDDEDRYLLDCAFAGLAVNYRVDRHVFAALRQIEPGWLTQVFASLVVNSLIDYRAKLLWDEAQKKTASPSEPAGVSFTPGEPDAGQDSAPRAAS